MTDQVRITVEYKSCCFCDKPTFKTIAVPFKPRFQWRKAVRQVAKLNGIDRLKFYPGTSATGALSMKCRHFDLQWVRFDWSIIY